MRKGEQTRDLIVARSAPIFNRQGYHGASMTDIMTAVGLQKGGIYNHFACKEELALAAFDHNWARMHALLTSALAKADPSPTEQLRAVITMHLHAGPQGLPPGGCPLMNTAIEQDDGNPVLRARAQAALDEWRALLVALIQAGVATGKFRSPADADALATVIISGLEGALMLTQLYQDDRYLKRTVEHLEQTVLAQLTV